MSLLPAIYVHTKCSCATNTLVVVVYAKRLITIAQKYRLCIYNNDKTLYLVCVL